MILKSSYLEIIVQYSIFIWTYFFSLALSSYFQTIYTSSLGDNTALRSGYRTFNPLPLLDELGFICLIGLGWGWHKPVPIDPTKIRGKCCGLRMLLTQFSMPIIHMGITGVSLLLLALLYPAQIRILFLTLTYGMHPQEQLLTGDFSGMTLITTLFLSSMVYYNSIMASLSVLRIAYEKILTYIVHKTSIRSPYLEYALFLGPVITFFFITRYVISYVLVVDYKLFSQFAGLGG